MNLLVCTDALLPALRQVERRSWTKDSGVCRCLLLWQTPVFGRVELTCVAVLSAEQAQRIHALADGIATTGVPVGARGTQEMVWSFAVPTQLHEIAVFVDQPVRGSLSVTAQIPSASAGVGANEASRVRIPVGNLQLGWNRLAIPDALAAAAMFTVSTTGLTAARESVGSIAESHEYAAPV